MAKKHASGKTTDVVEKLCSPVAEQMNLVIWDVTFAREGADWILRIVIDSENGVDLDTAAEFSRIIDPILDEEDPIEQSYSLEVCSAGLNRELTRDWHFEACSGEPLLVRTIRPVGDSGLRDFQGTLENYDKDTLTIMTENEAVVLNRDNLAYVKLDDFSEDDFDESSGSEPVAEEE